MGILSRIIPAPAAAVCALAVLSGAAPASANETAYLMYLKGSEGPPAVPMRVVWDDTKPHISIDLGEKYEPALTKLKLPRVLEYDASRDKSQFVVRDPEFARFVKVVAASIVQAFLSASPLPAPWPHPPAAPVPPPPPLAPPP